MGRFKHNAGQEQLIEGLSYLIGINKKREAREKRTQAHLDEILDRLESCEELLEELYERFAQHAKEDKEVHKLLEEHAKKDNEQKCKHKHKHKHKHCSCD